ncbi:MAG: adenylosuccinate synthase [Candidatus Marinimicrobia bacterium]|nr:adenylosuccinate synthase [Candidatus Neomarinimicrobiota bacterium]
MPAYIVMGAQWGDEGKGKIVDVLAEKMDFVVRFQGGANAGHTVIHGETRYVTHLIPSGVISGNSVNIIGNGCVVNPSTLYEEMNVLIDQGVNISPGKFIVSPQAHMVLPVHQYLDKVLNEKIGTTVRGIGPAYTDKARRTGIRWERACDGSFEEAYREHLDFVEKVYAVIEKEEMEVLRDGIPEMVRTVERLKPFVRDARPILAQAVNDNSNILYEGAQGTFLDIDHGTYPYVTSSNTSIGGAYTGSGVFLNFDKRIAIAKSYTTRVGEGPFPTELFDDNGEKLRRNGNEFGATTGRPRRCGWLDLALLKQSCMINGFNYIVFSKISCLSGFETLKVAVDYTPDGSPVYEELPGWREDVLGYTDFSALPYNCRRYIQFVEEFLGVPVGMVSTGPDRGHVIRRLPVFG